ncbi:MAG: hypothetical protein LAT62_09905 [Natronospirillum sp.]|uniref:hypothetical protein n=1 Tax=Natronospirillum sp. TaxID=2812955 RepID=UPI0025D6C77F|nr:hypothetical protein [Natronospirillum sp.]MCH8552239.1 hypothetical protein [Natronospirillum sp.]
MAESRRQRLARWIKHRAEEPQRNMALFTSGCLILMGGLFVIIMAELLLEPSLTQEIAAGSGVLLAAGGGIRALYGYLSIGLFKLLKYFLSDS